MPPLCTCGRRGCLEALASATALIRMTREARRTHPESLLNTLAPTEADVNGRTVFDAAAQGDAVAKAVADDYIHHLAVGVANLINIFFPEVIGLSGGVANQGENLLKPLRAAAAPMVFGSALPKSIPASRPARSATGRASSARRCWQSRRCEAWQKSS